MAVAQGTVAPHQHVADKPLEYQNPVQSVKILGFWIFLATDMLLFGCLFATYLVLRTHTDGGPTPHDIFDVRGFTIETFVLLTSSFTGGMSTLAMRNGNKRQLLTWLIVTIALGLTFVGFEASEFVSDALRGATMQRSAFLSAFFTLVGTHGTHVSIGIIWMIVTAIQVAKKGINPISARKVFVVNLYWHFLDVVWVFIFTVVYLSGVVM